MICLGERFTNIHRVSSAASTGTTASSIIEDLENVHLEMRDQVYILFYFNSFSFLVVFFIKVKFTV